jgi:hypothetical protein
MDLFKDGLLDGGGGGGDDDDDNDDDVVFLCFRLTCSVYEK